MKVAGVDAGGASMSPFAPRHDAISRNEGRFHSDPASRCPRKSESEPARQIKWISVGLVVAIALAVPPPCSPAAFRSAYEILGDLPVMHGGRPKPLGTMAAEEVRLIHGRSTIELSDAQGKTKARWEAVAALVDWSARPEFWENQDFILVECLPLKSLLLAESTRDQIRSLAGDESPEIRKSLRSLTERPELSAADLRTAARHAADASRIGQSLNALAARLDENHTWLSPSVLQNTRIERQGRTLSFPQWAAELLDEKDRVRSGKLRSAPELTPIEAEAAKVIERYFHYRALSEHKSRATISLDLQIFPRPNDEVYLKFSKEAFLKGMQPDQTLTPLEGDAANAFIAFLDGLESKNWALPREDAIVDQQLVSYLGGAAWIPLGIILRSDESELTRANVPLAQLVAFRKSFRELEAAERAAPGHVSIESAVALVTAARDLGAFFGRYPQSADVARESHFNRLAPFSKAPVAYFVGLLLLLLSLGFTAKERTAAGMVGVTLHCLGTAGLVAGIAFELYGFFLRYRMRSLVISMDAYWVPVTNLHDTVIWLALVAAVGGLAIELLWRKKYAALAGSAIAFVATFIALNVSILDSSLRVVPPGLRTNRWLAAHVLTIVSGYAAFALALGLGLLALGHYLTATYRRSPTYRELARPLLPGIPLYALGRLGIELPSGQFQLPFLDPTSFYYVSAGLAALGGILTLVGGFSVLGELGNRSPRRACVLGLMLVGLGSTALIAGATRAVPGPLASVLRSYDAWLVGLAGGVLTVMGLLGAHSRQASAAIDLMAEFIYRAMQLGVLLLAVGITTGGAWAHLRWGRYWAWEPKEVSALVVLLTYLVPLQARFAGWLSNFGVVTASVVCFIAVEMSWYGVNCVMRSGMHDYGFTEGADTRIVIACTIGVCAAVGAAWWRRSHAR